MKLIPPLIQTLKWLVLIPGLIAPVSAHMDPLIRDITGSRTKVVWEQCVTKTCECEGWTRNFRLMGYDSDEDSVRQIAPGPASYANPLITDNGQQVIFTDFGAPKDSIESGTCRWFKDNTAKVVGINWDGSGRTVLFEEGYGLCLQTDRDRNIEWLYVLHGPLRHVSSQPGSSIWRYSLDDTTLRELVWDKGPASVAFRVSGDGRKAGGEFPWNLAGTITLPNGVFQQFGSGCNSNIAPDNSYRFFLLTGPGHNELALYDSNGLNRRFISLTTVSWYPRWANHVRFFTYAKSPLAIGNLCEVTPVLGMKIKLARFDKAFAKMEQEISIADTGYNTAAFAWVQSASSAPLPIKIVSPLFDSARVWNTGMTMPIRWSADSVRIAGVDILFSRDNGNTWIPLAGRSITTYDTLWNNVNWTIPDTVRDDRGTAVATLSDKCRIKIRNYFGVEYDMTPAFAIADEPWSGVRPFKAGKASDAGHTRSGSVKFSSSGKKSDRAFDLQGKAIDAADKPAGSKKAIRPACYK